MVEQSTSVRQDLHETVLDIQKTFNQEMISVCKNQEMMTKGTCFFFCNAATATRTKKHSKL